MTAAAEASTGDRDTRRRRLALLGVLALLAGALAFGLRDDDRPAGPVADGPDTAELAALRASADLGDCPAALGMDLPDLVLPCLSGGPEVALAASGPGRPTLVNVWGSWCGPCVREVPLLADFADRAGERVGLVGVLTQDSLRSALTFAAESGMDWPSVVDDDGAVMRTYSPAPPVTLFVTPDGRVAHVERGEFTDVAQIEALVAEHLGVQL
jgi:cytochrome c biogenesis protein CcmG/thiol:disulfide interchange protein DsbE